MSMATVKRIPRRSKLAEELNSWGQDCFSTGGDDARTESNEEEEANSGAESDCLDSVELVEHSGGEFCQVGDRNFVVPLDLYELQDLSGILSIETWNNCLTEEERFALSEFLPDMDHDTFTRTLTELFSGANFHFGNPLAELFDQMKGGLCQPRVALYRQGLKFLQKREHYHFLHKYQNSMIGNFLQIKEYWSSCADYGIEERLRLLNIMRSRRVLMQEKDEDMLTLQSETESVDWEDPSVGLISSSWSRRPKSKHLYARQSTVQEDLLAERTGHRAATAVKPSFSFLSREGPGKQIESGKYGKRNSKGILKIVQKSLGNKEHAEFGGYTPSLTNQTYRPQVSLLAPSRPDQSIGHEAATGRRARNPIRVDGVEDQNYEAWSQTYCDTWKGSAEPSIRFSNRGKKMECFKKHDAEVGPNNVSEKDWQNGENIREGNTKGIIRRQLSSKNENAQYNRHWKVRGMADIERLMALPLADRVHELYVKDTSKGDKHSEKQKRPFLEDQMNSISDRVEHVGQVAIHGNRHHAITGGHIDWAVGSPPFQHNFPSDDKKRGQGEAFILDHTAKSDEPGCKKSKKWKKGDGRPVTNADGTVCLRTKSSKRFQVQQNSSDEIVSIGSLQYHGSDRRTKACWDIRKRKHSQKAGIYVDNLSGMTESGDNTHSSLFNNFDEKVDATVVSKRMGHDSGLSDMLRLFPTVSVDGPLKTYNLTGKVRKESLQLNGGGDPSTALEGNPNDRPQVPKLNVYSSRRKLKGKPDQKLLDSSGGASHHQNVVAAIANDSKETLVSARNAFDGWSDAHKICSADKKHKEKADLKHTIDPTKTKYQQGCESDDTEDSDSPEWSWPNKLLKRCEKGDIQDFGYGSQYTSLNRERLQMSSFDKKLEKKKGKGESKYLNSKDEPVLMNDVLTSTLQHIEDASISKKQRKKKTTSQTGPLSMVSSVQGLPERGPFKDGLELKLPRESSILIKPSVLSGFPFSIIHLLSAVRTALTDIYVNDTSKNNRSRTHQVKVDQKGNPDGVPVDMRYSEHADDKSFPSLSFQEIVNSVRLKPGDPSILKSQEPLQDLVRGVLKIFSAKTAPLGAKGWMPLALYKKALRSWSWIGPPPPFKSCGHDSREVETSPGAWGISYKMLVKLVDSYANWLKNNQETLRQLGSLPAPPASLLLTVDEKERFRDLRAQKSLTTISPNSDEARAYFRKEEYLRYTVPERAFAYTAADGRKSVVAPLRRGGGKPITKARDHFMLKPDRPPHVTVLCLVRDASARLPGSIGTRADVCTLIRDSQYIVEDVSDAQVNQVVSGALDRLHYERDPCVQFDGERKLWVYLHRERDDEDFEDDGTSSTKKCKRPKKEGPEGSDMGLVSDAGCHGTADQIARASAAGDDASKLNVES